MSRHFNQMRRRILFGFVCVLLAASAAALWLPAGVRAMPVPAFTTGSIPPDSNCSNTSVGLMPIEDLGTGSYKGFQGGLYPNGSNQVPPTYLATGQAQAKAITPLNFNGQPDPINGRIVLLSIGMSNTSLEFSGFVSMEQNDPQKNRQLQVIDGAQFGSTADLIINPKDAYWSYVQTQLSQAGVSAAQVEVIWLKEAIDYLRVPPATFPTDAVSLQTDLATIVGILQSTFPNLKIIYLASRVYGGYATTGLNPEPYAYDSSFADKWLVQDRITGITHGSAWLAWGPYLWADGTKPRSDGLTWVCSDFRPTDGTHPSASGILKVDNMLSAFFKSDPTATGWFLKP